VIDELRHELTAAGIRGRRRDRILAEFADHLACDPQAELGEPRKLAQQFADDLAVQTTRRAAVWAFGGLTLVALAVGLPALTLPTVPDIAGGRSPVLAGGATIALVVGAQVAFAVGCLALVRALRRPEDVAVVRRRTTVALGAGALTALGSALYAVNFWADVPTWWALLSVVAAAAALVPLARPAHALVHVGRLRTTRHERAQGLTADLGPFAEPLWIGTAVTLAMLAATSVAERSIVEGALRAAFEGVAFTLCFLAFRRPLALTD
jgi:hypothetical protein